jgi:hypothetical protein
MQLLLGLSLYATWATPISYTDNQHLKKIQPALIPARFWTIFFHPLNTSYEKPPVVSLYS